MSYIGNLGNQGKELLPVSGAITLPKPVQVKDLIMPIPVIPNRLLSLN